jgi:phosphatidylglycerophosphatase A
MTPDTEPASPAAPPRKKPHISFLLATWFGLGYLPKAPGTWGSLAGSILGFAIVRVSAVAPSSDFWIHDRFFVVHWNVLACCSLGIAALGIWSSSRVVSFTGIKDPQYVVIDEVSGQMLTLFLGGFALTTNSFGIATRTSPYLFFDGRLLTPVIAFILFRLFDIWKPFPIRKLEKLPGGWGIMADDWLAGIYAAILLRLALHFNLL